jgi:hypothetical protein
MVLMNLHVSNEKVVDLEVSVDDVALVDVLYDLENVVGVAEDERLRHGPVELPVVVDGRQQAAPRLEVGHQQATVVEHVRLADLDYGLALARRKNRDYA